MGPLKPTSRNMKGPRPVPIEERFNKYVRRTDGCWLWIGSKNPHGYGVFWANPIERRLVVAPRVAWQIWRGPIPGGLCVCHRCDAPACVNPEHLFLATQGENMRDCYRKERKRRRPACLDDPVARAKRAKTFSAMFRSGYLTPLRDASGRLAGSRIREPHSGDARALAPSRATL